MNGETWMEPLLELRQDLKDTQDPEIKKKVRDVKHRNGKIIFWIGSFGIIGSSTQWNFVKII